VSVIVKQIVSYVLYVQGEVKAPGAYPVTAPTNLVQLISMAGGFTEWADPSKIKMLREVAGAAHLIIIDYHSVIGGKAPEWMAPLQSGDTVIVP